MAEYFKSYLGISKNFNFGAISVKWKLSSLSLEHNKMYQKTKSTLRNSTAMKSLKENKTTKKSTQSQLDLSSQNNALFGVAKTCTRTLFP